MTKTPFQSRFGINTQFYTGQQIRAAIAECFPFTDRGYQGLSRILHESDVVPYEATRKLELQALIPDLRKGLPTFGSVGIIEGTPEIEIIASTFFVPTPAGYMCSEMDIPGQDQVTKEIWVR